MKNYFNIDGFGQVRKIQPRKASTGKFVGKDQCGLI